MWHIAKKKSTIIDYTRKPGARCCCAISELTSSDFVWVLGEFDEGAMLSLSWPGFDERAMLAF